MRRVLQKAWVATAFLALSIVLGLALSTPTTASAAALTAKDNPRPIGVRILSGSQINLVSHESKLPIAITNEFDTQVRVLVHVEPRNYLVTMPEAIEVSIPAQTTVTAKVPISAIADGSVTIDAWLTTFSGQKFGRIVELNVTVSEDVELYILLGFGAAVSLLLAVGVVRTLRRRARTEVSA